MWADQPLLPVIWYVTHMQNSGMLPELLEDPTQWQQSPPVMLWDDQSHYHAAWTQLHAQIGRDIQLVIDTPAKVTVFVDQQSVPIKQSNDEHTITLSSIGKPMSVCVLLDFGHGNQPCICKISVKVK